MLKINIDDTIAAISTAIGSGGIGIVRISGGNSLNIISNIFKPVKNKDISNIKSHTINYGYIYDGNEIIDEVLVMIMKKPNTYTKEDVVEINCHGGIKSLQSVLSVVLKNGARIAEPGEFTKRAFLNGRIDLSQAEAVIDIINAKTEMSHKSALNRLEGSLLNKITNLREQILTLTAHIEAAIDYPEHDIETITYKTIEDGANKILDSIDKLLLNYDTGRLIKDGINTVILGKPNVGKSSLLNKLLDEERAIVTDIPGTTRDILQEYINIGGIALNIIDTAGIRNTDDKIEKIGVEKSKEYARKADLIFLMIDNSKKLDKDDLELIKFVENKKTIVIINKIDLDNAVNLNEIKKYIDKNYILRLSVKNYIGFDLLFDKIKGLFFNGEINTNDEILITNERNKNSLSNAKNCLNNVIETINNKMPEDFISMDLLEAYSYLGEIIGQSLDEDIIDKIFSEFCLGK